jgi:hypothetical protein
VIAGNRSLSYTLSEQVETNLILNGKRNEYPINFKGKSH